MKSFNFNGFKAEQIANNEVVFSNSIAFIYNTTSGYNVTLFNDVPGLVSLKDSFKAYKTVLSEVWTRTALELDLQKASKAFKTIYKKARPDQIRFYCDDAIYNVDLSGSAWSQIAIVPHKKDIDGLNSRAIKKRVHYIAKLSFGLVLENATGSIYTNMFDALTEQEKVDAKEVAKENATTNAKKPVTKKPAKTKEVVTTK